MDNVLKPLFDTYQGIFEEFNDNKVYYVELYKTIVPKGREFLYVRVGRANPNKIQEATTFAEKTGSVDEAAQDTSK